MAASGGAPVLRILLDTNVVLDWLLDRKPWSDQAQPLWDARDADRVIGYMPASALTDVFYIARRQIGIPGAEGAVDRCLAAFEILPVDKTVLLRARALPGGDFEDNVQMACAEAASLDLNRDTQCRRLPPCVDSRGRAAQSSRSSRTSPIRVRAAGDWHTPGDIQYNALSSLFKRTELPVIGMSLRCCHGKDEFLARVL